MIEFKDEILEGEPQYSVRDANGNAIHDDVSIELSTPVRQAGTPLNKPFFENIQAYIKSTDRYNLVNATVDTTIDGEYQKNFFKREWSKIADGQYQSGKMIVSTNVEWSYPCYLAFDGDASTAAAEGLHNNTDKIIRIDYGEEVKITELYVDIDIYIDTGSIKLQASKDNSSWVDIATFTNEDVEEYDIVVANPDWYRYYRVYSTSKYNSYSLRELQTKKMIIHQTQVLTSELKLDRYENGKLVKIETPKNFDETALNNYININNLGNTQILGAMRAGEQYTLQYDGNGFVVTPEEIETSTKTVKLEIFDNGGTQTKNLQFRVGKSKLVALSLYGSTSYSIGITPSAFIILDTERNKFLFTIGNKRVVKYNITNSAAGEVQSDVSTQPITVGTDGTGRVDLANFWRNDSYGRVDEMAIYVSNISLSEGILTIPASLYTNSRVQEQTASVSCFVNVIK
jgi:hypothetical protein